MNLLNIREKRKFRNLLKFGLMVWCRHGNVIQNATPCINLECEYKKDKKDVVNGCLKCRHFQITSPVTSWEHANFIYFKANSVYQQRD